MFLRQRPCHSLKQTPLIMIVVSKIADIVRHHGHSDTQSGVQCRGFLGGFFQRLSCSSVEIIISFAKQRVAVDIFVFEWGSRSFDVKTAVNIIKPLRVQCHKLSVLYAYNYDHNQIYWLLKDPLPRSASVIRTCSIPVLWTGLCRLCKDKTVCGSARHADVQYCTIIIYCSMTMSAHSHPVCPGVRQHCIYAVQNFRYLQLTNNTMSSLSCVWRYRFQCKFPPKILHTPKAKLWNPPVGWTKYF